MAEQYGLRFEREVIEQLEGHGCRLTHNRHLDECEKVDFIIRSLHGCELRFPAEVQLTMQGGCLFKLKNYLETRRLRPDGAHYYIVAPTGIKPRKAAEQIMDFVLWKHVANPPGPGIFGVFLQKGRGWEEFDPEDRLAWLRRRADPNATADRRLEGEVCRLGAYRFWIEIPGEDRLFIAYYSDVAEEDLYLQLCGMRDGLRRHLLPIGVNFYQNNSQALSIIRSRL